MKAMLIHEYGKNVVFEISEIEKPEVKVGHVLVEIAASSVNTVDTMIRNMGENLALAPETPALLGMDFAGTIEAVGEGVNGYKVGDEVYGCAGGLSDLPGTLADYIVADIDLLAHKPKNLSMREAAALPLVAITAYEGLMRSGVKEGQKVLVQGGGRWCRSCCSAISKIFWSGRVRNWFRREEIADYRRLWSYCH